MIVAAIGIEIVAVVFIVWGIFNENKLIGFEREMIKVMREHKKLRQKEDVLKWLDEQGLVVIPKSVIYDGVRFDDKQ